MQGDFQRPDTTWGRALESGPSWSANLNQQQQQHHRYPPAPDSANGSDVKGNGNASGSGDGKAQPPPKRGAKACTACESSAPSSILLIARSQREESLRGRSELCRSWQRGESLTIRIHASAVSPMAQNASSRSPQQPAQRVQLL
jgi:hypothetical protein